MDMMSEIPHLFVSLNMYYVYLCVLLEGNEIIGAAVLRRQNKTFMPNCINIFCFFYGHHRVFKQLVAIYSPSIPYIGFLLLQAVFTMMCKRWERITQFDTQLSSRYIQSCCPPSRQTVPVNGVCFCYVAVDVDQPT